MKASSRGAMEKILTVYSLELGYVSPCHVIDWNPGSTEEEEVRIALGTLASWGRLKNPGFGAGREVARKVTCRWTYGCFL
jgi:hypothetical protein